MICMKILAKFGYKLNTKIIFQKKKKNILLYFWLASWIMYRNQVTLLLLLNLNRVPAIENLKKHMMILGLLIFKYSISAMYI